MRAENAEGLKTFEAEGWSTQAETYGGLTGAITSRLAEPLLDAAGVRRRVAGTQEFWRGILGSSVRTAALLRAQSALARRRIRAALERMVAPYRGSDGAFELAVAAKLASGRKR